MSKSARNSLPAPLERDIQAAVLDACSLYPWIRVWRCNTGGAKFQNSNGTTSHVRFGERGLSDILGFIHPIGRFAAIEVKRPGTYATKEQKSFLMNVRDGGGFAVIVRNADQIMCHLRFLELDRSYSPDPKWLV